MAYRYYIWDLEKNDTVRHQDVQNDVLPAKLCEVAVTMNRNAGKVKYVVAKPEEYEAVKKHVLGQ